MKESKNKSSQTKLTRWNLQPLLQLLADPFRSVFRLKEINKSKN